MRRLAALCLMAALGGPLPAMAEGAAALARDAARDLVAAVEGLAQARGARDRVDALTATIAAHEAGLSALREGLRLATLREAEIRRQFDSRRTEVATLLSAMMAVERVEPPALMMHPDGPLATARAGMMLTDLAAAMQGEAARIGSLLAELEQLRAVRAEAEATLTAALTSLQEARAELSQAIADRRTLPPPIGEDETALLALLASADTLDGFAAGLLETPAALEGDLPAFDGAIGTLTLPVRGTLLRRAGEADAAGLARPGLLLATEDGALVTAPWHGTVRYRGPLLDYGNVVLIEPETGYLLVIAGLDAVFPRLGAVVATGDALGLMPGGSAVAGEFAPAPARLVERSQTLYVEARQNGQPIDPALWFDLTAAR